MRHLSRTWVRTTAAAVAAAGLAVHACADSRGSLRMIPANGACAVNETPVNWNAQGVPGATGAQGPAGVRGLRGRAGKKGKIKLNLSGDIGTQLILGRLKALNKKVVSIQGKVQDTKDAALFLKGYLKVHHQHGATCKQVESVYHYVQIVNNPDNGGVPVLPLGLGCK